MPRPTLKVEEETRMRSFFLVITTVLVVAAGPASLAAQRATDNTLQQALHIGGNNIGDPCESIR